MVSESKAMYPRIEGMKSGEQDGGYDEGGQFAGLG